MRVYVFSYSFRNNLTSSCFMFWQRSKFGDIVQRRLVGRKPNMVASFLLLSFIIHAVGGSFREMKLQARRNTCSDVAPFCQLYPLTAISCAVQCCKRQRCVAYNIKDGVCQLLPSGDGSFVHSDKCTHYFDRSRKLFQ